MSNIKQAIQLRLEGYSYDKIALKLGISICYTWQLINGYSDQKKAGIIYRVTNLKSGKIYIGQTIKTLKARKQQHLHRATYGSQLYFHRALAKYPAEAFLWEVLYKSIPRSQLGYVEQFEILHHNSNEKGYNCTFGGDDNPMRNQQSIDKMRAKLTGRPGKKKDKEWKKKISKGNKDFWALHPDYAKARVAARKGINLSEECRQKISNGLRKWYDKNSSSQLILSDSDVVDIRRASLEGVSTKVLDQKYKVSHSYIRGICSGNMRSNVAGLLEEVRQRSICRKNPRLSPHLVLTIRERYDCGESCKSIARDLKLSRTRVWKVATRKNYREINVS